MLIHLAFCKDILIKSVGDESISKATFVVVESGVDNRPIYEDYFISIFVFVEDGRPILYLFVEVGVINVELIDFLPSPISSFLCKFMKWNFDDVNLSLLLQLRL